MGGTNSDDNADSKRGKAARLAVDGLYARNVTMQDEMVSLSIRVHVPSPLLTDEDFREQTEADPAHEGDEGSSSVVLLGDGKVKEKLDYSNQKFRVH